MKCKIFTGRNVQDQINKFLLIRSPNEVKFILQSESDVNFENSHIINITVTIFYEEK